MSDHIGDIGNDEESGIQTIPRSKTKKPKLYMVLMHNDDYTTMEFVIHVLKRYFGKNAIDAENIMMKIHTEGSAICGIYTYEIAESKADRVMKVAEREGHPLRLSVEAES